MANPLSGIITAEFKQLFNYAIDALLEDTALTVTCRIYYGTTKNTQCPNCILDNNARVSANQYKPGGPVSFATGSICPMCGGIGFIASDTSETFNMAIIYGYNRTKFIQTGQNLKEGVFYVQSVCKLDRFPNLKNAKEAVFDTSVEGIGKYKFERYGDPTPVNFGTTPYIVTNWTRKG
jgi:hypothetical protein